MDVVIVFKCYMEIDLVCGSGVALLLYKAIRFSLGCRHDGRPSRRDEGSLELHPGLFVPLDARGQRSDHRSVGRVVTTLDVIGLEAFVPEPPRGPGRPPEDRRALARAFVAKAVLGVPTTSALIERLDVDKSLRRILGWERRSQVPSEATFSSVRRVRARRAARQDPRRADRAYARGTHHRAIARDATEIEAREKPVQNKANDGKDDPPAPDNPPPPRKRGRPRKDEQRPKPEPTRLERQVMQNLGQMLADLPTACDVGGKKNSKGYKETWTGYKLHIDVACGQIPVFCVLTSASVHDSQVAIPLMTMTSARVSCLYDLMDAAYDAAAIHDQSRALGPPPSSTADFRADREGEAEWGREVERLKLIHMPYFETQHDFDHGRTRRRPFETRVRRSSPRP